MIRFLPRDATTVQEILGDEAAWSDTEYLLALIGDSLAQANWMYAGVHAKNASKKPPPPIRRPGDGPGERNLATRTEITAGSLTLAELNAAVARQTGSPLGIAEEV